jgi:hypothetical protein
MAIAQLERQQVLSLMFYDITVIANRPSVELGVFLLYRIFNKYEYTVTLILLSDSLTIYKVGVY